MADPVCEFCRASDCRSVTAPTSVRLVEALNCARRRIGVLEAAGDALSEEMGSVIASLPSKRTIARDNLSAARNAWTKARGK